MNNSQIASNILFVVLLIWSVLVPYLFDYAHMTGCDERNTVTFYFLTESYDYTCQPLPKGENL